MMLLSGASKTEVARDLKVGRCTVHKWCAMPVVQEELRRGRQEITHAAELEIRMAVRLAVRETIRICAQGLEEKDRLKAADMILTRASFEVTPDPPAAQAHPLVSALAQVAEAIHATGGVQAVLSQAPEQPTDDEMDPYAGIERRDQELAALRAELAVLRAKPNQ